MSVHMSVESKMNESKKGITEGPNLATIFIFVKVAQSIDFLLFSFPPKNNDFGKNSEL